MSTAAERALARLTDDEIAEIRKATADGIARNLEAANERLAREYPDTWNGTGAVVNDGNR